MSLCAALSESHILTLTLGEVLLHIPTRSDSGRGGGGRASGSNSALSLLILSNQRPPCNMQQVTVDNSSVLTPTGKVLYHTSSKETCSTVKPEEAEKYKSIMQNKTISNRNLSKVNLSMQYTYIKNKCTYPSHCYSINKGDVRLSV